MQKPLTNSELARIALDPILAKLEAIEVASRQLEAERLRLLAAAFDTAAFASEEE